MIKRVIYLLLENRSFDHVLGCFKELYKNLEGVDTTDLKENSYGGLSIGKLLVQRPSLNSIRDMNTNTWPFNSRMETVASLRTMRSRIQRRSQATCWK
jgi:phospholipase C